jgi:hypothetical protein
LLIFILFKQKKISFPAFNFFIVFCIPWSALGLIALLQELNKISHSTNLGLGYFFNALWLLLSPIWTFTMAFLLAPGKLACVANVLVWVSCDWWVYVLAMFGEGALYMALTIIFE